MSPKDAERILTATAAVEYLQDAIAEIADKTDDPVVIRARCNEFYSDAIEAHPKVKVWVGKADFNKMVSEAIATKIKLANTPWQQGTAPAWSGDCELDYAMHFAQRHSGRLLYCTETGHWYLWNERRWVRDRHDAVHHILAHDAILTRTRLALSGDNRLKSLVRDIGKARTVAAILSIVGAHPGIAVTADDLDANPMLIGTPIGVLDLATDKMLDPDPSLRITKSTRVVPAATEDCPHWLAFLQQTHKGQDDAIDYLKRLFGYCLTGLQREEMVNFFYGTGGNGKGTETGAAEHAMGDYAVAAQDGAFTRPKIGHRPHAQVIARLRGARLVRASEPADGDIWDMARVKEWTGNDGRITANLMHKDGFEFDAIGKLIMVADRKLELDRVDPAVRRRMRLVSHPHKPATPDRKLKERLEAEAPGILRWMLNGLADYHAKGLEPTTSITTATKDYLDEQDVIGRFMTDCLMPKQGSQCLLSDAAAAYNGWAHDSGEKPRRRGLGEELKARGVLITKSGGITWLRSHQLTETGLKARDAQKAHRAHEKAKN